jgi:chromosome segregation ATPase
MFIEVTLQDLHRELKILQARVNGQDNKIDQATEKLELDYTELKEMKARIVVTEERQAVTAADIQSLTVRVDQGEEGLKATAKKLDELQETVELDRAQTIQQISDHCERLDQHSNAAKSHCVLITGTSHDIKIIREAYQHLVFDFF